MHECSMCGIQCDCDGEDVDQPEPPDHVCINPECEASSDYWDRVWDEFKEP